jgi:hypothetical protein
MEDNSDIAFLAALAEKEMRKNLQGSQGLSYQKTDWRRFLNPNQQIPPHIQQQIYQQQQPPPYYPQQYQQAPQEPYIPEGTLPPTNPQLLPLPQGFQQPQGTIQQPNPESYQTFQIPNYNEPPKTYLEDEKEFRDALIKEIKSLKNTIKDLKKQVTSFMVSIKPVIENFQPKSETVITNEDHNQS